MSTGEAAPALDYAPAPRVTRRRIWTLAIALSLIACGYASWRWGPAWWDRANLLYAQRQVMNYDPPADRIVMSNVAEDVASLPGVVSGYQLAHRRLRTLITRKAGDRGWKHEEIKPLDFVWYTHLPWSRFPAGSWQPGPAFVHGLVSASGERRLIALELSVVGDRLMIYCRSLKPMSWSDDGDLLRAPPLRTRVGTYYINGFEQKPLRMYAGQADAKDASAFTIRCESEGRSALIHGRLGDSGLVMLYVTEPWLVERWGSGKPDHPMIFVSPTTRPARNASQKLFADEPQTPRP